MPKIRHLAIISMNPDKLAKFYCEVFEMTEVSRSPNGNVHLTDGYLRVAILRNKADGKANGLNHFGFEVESNDVIRERLKGWEVVPPDSSRDDRPYVEVRATDPEGNMFDLAEQDFATLDVDKARAAAKA